MKFYARFVVQPLLLLPHEYCYCSSSKSGNIEKANGAELSKVEWRGVECSGLEQIWAGQEESTLAHGCYDHMARVGLPQTDLHKLSCWSRAIHQPNLHSIDRSIAPSMFLCLWVSFSPSFTIDRRSFANPSHKMCNFQLLNHQWGKRKIEKKKSQNVTYRNQANTIDWLSNGLSAPRLWFWRLLIITAVCCARKFVV